MAGLAAWRTCRAGGRPTICCRAGGSSTTPKARPRSAAQPGPDDADRDHADDDRKRDRPAADADVADGLTRSLVLGDLAIALLVLLVGRTHRPLPAGAGQSRLWSPASM